MDNIKLCTCTTQQESDNCTVNCDHTYGTKLTEKELIDYKEAKQKHQESAEAQILWGQKHGMLPFEAYPQLKDSIQHAACHWKTDMEWTNHLQQINTIIVELENYAERLTTLLKTEVMKGVGGSKMNRIDHWEEYCKDNNIIE